MRGFRQLEDDLPADSLEQLGRTCHWQLELAQKQSYLMKQLQQAMPQTQLKHSTAAVARKPSSACDDALDALDVLKASTQHAPELRQHLSSQLRQAQVCIKTTKACTGIAHPADALQDGLKNRIVRLKNSSEAGFQKGRKAQATPLAANTDSAEPQTARFKQPSAAAEAGR